MESLTEYKSLNLITPEMFAEQFKKTLRHSECVDIRHSDDIAKYKALALTIRYYVIDRWQETRAKIHKTKHTKTVAYLSAEYLLGRRLPMAALSTRLEEVAREALESLSLNYDDIVNTEIEPGLGNGGLGRLAACYIDSLATLSIPSIGYGILYEYGIFTQTFNDRGEQVEVPDYWMDKKSAWGQPFYGKTQMIDFGGKTEKYTDDDGVERSRWIPAWSVRAIPYTYMIPGHKTGNVNSLRLWHSRAVNEFDLSKFNVGQYEAAVSGQTVAENISKVLYPEDSTPQGKVLRLEQQYFFASASIKDVIRSFYEKDADPDFRTLPEKIVFQLNDTHPVIAIAELMRILVDEYCYEWDLAWSITRKCFNYTCHTLLPEALEVWDVDMFRSLLPRHFEIIEKINDSFIAEAIKKLGGDDEAKHKAEQMSIFTSPGHSGGIRMAYLATIASEKVNGVAKLHSELLGKQVLPQFKEYTPEKFTNVTNGISPRRFLRLSNPALSELITDALGTSKWVSDLSLLSGLEKLSENAAFIKEFAFIKKENKTRFADMIYNRYDRRMIQTDALYDVMVKRLHEYKRQSLKILHIVTLYNKIKSGVLDIRDVTPRVFMFGAKAAPGYYLAKQTIQLINSIAYKINNDPVFEGKLSVIFPENYNVTMAEKLIPAADLSEQISLAGLEASGTGNMKLALNGALTVGTLDGANIEIREQVGEENFFLFGMKENEVEDLRKRGYNPKSYYEGIADLKQAIDTIRSGEFSIKGKTTFDDLTNDWMYHDRFMALADYQAYIDIQKEIDQAYGDQKNWNRMAVLNVARMGYFSSDRAVQEYIDKIWHVHPLPVNEPIYYLKDVKLINI
jgi:starch phosphorylase